MGQFITTRVFENGESTVVARTLGQQCRSAKEALIRFVHFDNEEIEEIIGKPWIDVTAGERHLLSKFKEQVEKTIAASSDGRAVYFEPGQLTTLVTVYDEEA